MGHWVQYRLMTSAIRLALLFTALVVGCSSAGKPEDGGVDAGNRDAGPQSTSCSSSCAGCCDDAGTCRAGRAQDECGEGGASCSACPAGKLCSAGACITVTQCDVACAAQCTCAVADAGTLAGSRWRLHVLSATIAPTRPSGAPWDEHNDPDPKVCAGTQCTLEQTDTFSPAWSTTLPGAYDYADLQSVQLSVIDVDFPGQTVIDELGVLDLRPRTGGTQQWSIDGASVTKLRVDVVPSP